MSQFEIKCPHCNAALNVQDDWIGMDVECPICKKKFSVQKDPVAPPPAATAPAESVQSDNSGTFIFICPFCGNMAELPGSLSGRKYECKACHEESLAEPTTEKKCPYCGKSIKIQAKICKYCKKEVPSSTDSIYDKFKHKSKAVRSSLQTTPGIKPRLYLKKSIFIISCLFFLAACIIFGFAVFSNRPYFSPRSETGLSGNFPSSSSSYSVSTSSYGSISVGESSYGTYKNAQSIADNANNIAGNAYKIANNTLDMLKLSSNFQKSLSAYYEADQRRTMLFNTSYGLLAMAIFLLLVSFFIDQILADKKSIMADQKNDNA